MLGFDTGFIEADPAELENALLNLVVNSVTRCLKAVPSRSKPQELMVIN